MINKEDYEYLRTLYGGYSSWMVWEEPLEGKPKSNIEKMDPFKSSTIRKELRTEYVFVGLNASRKLEGDWQNFHSASRYQNDYKLRYAFNHSRFLGSYITDVIKGIENPNSGQIMKKVSSGEIKIEEHIKALEDEIRVLRPKYIISIGKDADKLLKKHTDNRNIVNIPHYAIYVSKEQYKSMCERILTNI